MRIMQDKSEICVRGQEARFCKSKEKFLQNSAAL